MICDYPEFIKSTDSGSLHAIRTALHVSFTEEIYLCWLRRFDLHGRSGR